MKCIDDVDISDVEQNNIWYCRNCFHKICDDELPFSDGFIDFQCSIQKSLKIAHLNIQGLITDNNSKVDYVNLLLHDNGIDVLCINETWYEIVTQS